MPAKIAGPRIEFATPTFDLGKVKQGEVVRHEFVFRNAGDSVLVISDVKPSCGCTTAGEWDKRVEPGRTGIIPLQFKSAGFTGTIAKTATVTCNDPALPTVELEIKAAVWTPFTITPSMVVFTVSSETDTSETKLVRIVSNSDEPVNLSGLESANPVFRAELSTVKPDREFRLRVTAVPPFPSSSMSAPITLKTSSPEAPALKVLAQLVVQEPIVVQPAKITLSSTPLPATNRYSVTIRNNATSQLRLSDAGVNVPGAVVQLKEIQPNKLFQVSVQFPAGYQLRSEDKVEVSVQSNHPKYATIRVPVVVVARAIAPTNLAPANPGAEPPTTRVPAATPRIDATR